MGGAVGRGAQEGSQELCTAGWGCWEGHAGGEGHTGGGVVGRCTQVGGERGGVCWWGGHGEGHASAGVMGRGVQVGG